MLIKFVSKIIKGSWFSYNLLDFNKYLTKRLTKAFYVKIHTMT